MKCFFYCQGQNTVDPSGRAVQVQGRFSKISGAITGAIVSVQWLYLARVAAFLWFTGFCLTSTVPILPVIGLCFFKDRIPYVITHTRSVFNCPEFYTVGHRAADRNSEPWTDWENVPRDLLVSMGSQTVNKICSAVNSLLAPCEKPLLPIPSAESRALRTLLAPINGLLFACDEGLKPMVWRALLVVAATEMLPLSPLFQILNRFSFVSIYSAAFKHSYSVLISKFPVVQLVVARVWKVFSRFIMIGFLAPSITVVKFLMIWLLSFYPPIISTLWRFGFDLSKSDKLKMHNQFESSKMRGSGSDAYLDLTKVSSNQREAYVDCQVDLERVEKATNLMALPWLLLTMDRRFAG